MVSYYLLAISCRLAHFVAEIVRFRTSEANPLNSDEFCDIWSRPSAATKICDDLRSAMQVLIEEMQCHFLVIGQMRVQVSDGDDSHERSIGTNNR